MKPLVSIFLLGALSAFAWTSSAPGPSAAAPVAVVQGTGPTGALGLLPDPMYPPGDHVIDLESTGAYDAARWMVVLDYESFTVQAGATVRFLNHPSRAPVVIRATGPVTIEGELNLDGAQGGAWNESPGFAEPGPGGFRGGRGAYYSSRPSAGFGPGGGLQPEPGYGQSGGAGSHASAGFGGSGAPAAPVYGSPSARPLAGGSGGAAGDQDPTGYRNAGGGAGGGAIRIGSDLRVRISGTVAARGGEQGEGTTSGGSPSYQGWGGRGSGGSIHVFAPEVDLDPGSLLDARGGTGAQAAGVGFVRLEVDGTTQQDGDPNPNRAGNVGPEPSVAYALGEFIPADPPTVRLAAWFDPDLGPSGEWVDLPIDPRAAYEPAPWADLQLAAPGATLFRVEGHDVPLGSPLHVRLGFTRGQATFDSTHTMGEVAGSTLSQSWTDVSIDLSEGVSAIQVRAELP